MADYQLHPERDLTVLVPARAGSKRCPGKNTRLLGGKPLIQWTIDAAKSANVAEIIVSTDDAVTEGIARDNELQLHHRKPQHATDDAPDALWVNDLIHLVATPFLAICRPTSPFRTASTIRRAFAALHHRHDLDSIRAVERVIHPHPAKMWILGEHTMKPVMEGAGSAPWHSMPSQLLPEVYKQNASLEMVRTASVLATGTISGYRIGPFLTEALEGFDINTAEDFERAERLIAEGRMSGS